MGVVDIDSPEDVNLAVRRLPAHQRPFGADCPLGVDIQSVLFHYDLDGNVDDVVGHLLRHKLTRLKVEITPEITVSKQIFCNIFIVC